LSVLYEAITMVKSDTEHSVVIGHCPGSFLPVM